MTSISYQILEKRQKMHIKAYAMLCIALAVAMGFYIYKNWREYHMASLGNEVNREYITVLRDEVQDEKAKQESQKSDADKLNAEISDKLSMIFPHGDNYTALTRQINAYEQELAKKNSAFEISNIDYQTPVESTNYSILPMRMNISSSRKNFTKFLHLIENSGALNSDIRLMDISSIKLNFDESDEENIEFSIQVNAYYQK